MAKEPIPSTALIPVRGKLVFWARRSRPLKFMGGFHSFPGGKIDPEDTQIPVDDLESTAEASHVVSVIRELFEETGWLCAPGIHHDGSLEADRQALLAGAISFKDILQHHGLRLSGRGIMPAGTWVTPKFQKIRFASYYFMMEVPPEAEFRLNPREHDEGGWIDPALALSLWDQGRVTLPPPVVYTLQCLAQSPSPASALEKLRRPPQIYGMPGKRIEFRKGIQILPLKSDTLPPAEHTNLHIVGHKKLFLIDPATTYEEDRNLLLDYLDHLKADGMQPHRILLTHQHHDHSSAARWLRDTFKIPVAASAITNTLLSPTCPVD
ncbi:MAG: MBL fold metallo-hydrolase [Planctomycetota bacterium]